MIRYAVFAAAFFALATVRDAVTLKDNMSAVFWPETGLLVAVLVLTKRKDWFPFLALGFLVFLADSTVLKQRPVPLSVIFAASLCFVSTLGASAYLFFVDGKKKSFGIRELAWFTLFGVVVTTFLAAGGSNSELTARNATRARLISGQRRVIVLDIGLAKFKRDPWVSQALALNQISSRTRQLEKE